MTDRYSALQQFVAESRRRRVFRTAGMYIVGAWLVMQVADLFFPAWGLPDAALNVLLVAAFFGFPLALVFGWFFDITVRGIVRTPPADAVGDERALSLQRRDYVLLAAIVVIGAAIVYDSVREIVETPRVTGGAVVDTGAGELLPNSIAVLPFTNISADPENEYFCDGISEEILNKLGAFAGLTVIGRTSSFAFKGSSVQLPRISAMLRAGHLLQGSVQKYGNKVRISAQLVDKVGTQVWSNTFDRTLEDIFAIQTEIADVVATTIAPQIIAPDDARYEPKLDAYEQFLAGRELLRSRRLLEAHTVLKEAVDLDPGFAAAYAELAISLLIGVPATDELAAANDAIDTALRLEPGMTRALAARGLALSQQAIPDWAAAETVLRDVVARDPGMVDALNWLSSPLSAQGKEAESFEVLKRAARLDPLHPAVVSNLADAYFQRGEVAAAEQALLRLIDAPRPTPYAFIGLRNLYRQTGRLADMNAIEKRRALNVEWVHYGLALNYALFGLWNQAAYWSERSKVDAPDVVWARIYSANVPSWRGDFRKAIAEFDKALGEGESRFTDVPREFRFFYGELQSLAGDYAAAIATLEHVVDPKQSFQYGDYNEYVRLALHALAWSYMKQGHTDKADAILASLEQSLLAVQRKGLLHESDDLYFFARNAALTGNRDLALQRLRQAVDAGWREVYINDADPRWEAVADDPRYRALMAEVRADVDRQRAEVERRDAEEDFPALLDRVQASRRQVATRAD